MVQMTEAEWDEFTGKAHKNYMETELELSYQDMLKAEAKKRGWIVPSAIELARELAKEFCNSNTSNLAIDAFTYFDKSYSELEEENKRLREEK